MEIIGYVLIIAAAIWQNSFVQDIRITLSTLMVMTGAFFVAWNK